jgi:hypothetical protein
MEHKERVSSLCAQFLSHIEDTVQISIFILCERRKKWQKKYSTYFFSYFIEYSLLLAVLSRVQAYMTFRELAMLVTSGIDCISSSPSSPPPLPSSVTQQPKSGLGCLILSFLDLTQLDTYTPHDSPERVISPSHTPLPTQTTTSMPSAGFELAITALKQLETYALDCTATRINMDCNYATYLSSILLVVL